MRETPEGWRSIYEQNAALVWLAVLAVPLLFIGAGFLLAPGFFYDQFIWQHLWGPLYADGHQISAACLDPAGRVTATGLDAAGNPRCPAGSTGAKEGYTLVSEGVYGILLAIAVFGIYVHVLRRHRVETGAGFLAALIPFIALGPVARSLEDSSLFAPPYSYLFISPVIYVQISILVLIFMLVGIHVAARHVERPRKAMLLFGATLLAFVSLYGAVTTGDPERFAYLPHPVLMLLFGLLATGLFGLQLQRGASPVNASLFAGGIAFVLPGVFLVTRWITVGQWGPGGAVTLNPAYLGYVLVPAVGITALVFLAGRLLSKRRAHVLPYAVGVNAALVFAHMLDAFATFFAVCSSNSPSAPCHGASGFGLNLIGYGEKHPVSNFLLTFGDGWGFPIIKFLMILVVIHVIDSELKQDLGHDENMAGLVKLAVFILGFAPGTRDVLRVVMGI
ncbi:MAG: DUF63 family protein [Euryarchaeota archaeon]|nr:DUF63 family protein [Euryarchaeota archaeon]